MRLYPIASIILCLWWGLTLKAQSYIGFAYPAGGQRGTRVICTLGGQALNGLKGVTVSGTGVNGQILEYNKRLNPQIIQLLREQLKELRALAPAEGTPTTTNMMHRIERLINNYVAQPQCDSIANLVIVALDIAPDARPGEREIRLYTHRSISNPLPFHIGVLPEVCGTPMGTTPKPILGKEAQSLPRRTPPKNISPLQAATPHLTTLKAGIGTHSILDDAEMSVTLPVVVNGQIAPGAVDRIRFEAHAGQQLVLHTQARSLIPYLADAVPGWFQPVLILCDTNGHEVAYNDDYRFDPDPTIFFTVPADGSYIAAIHDALYRGREDFVYRLTIGELPFITDITPLGTQWQHPISPTLHGYNLTTMTMTTPLANLPPGQHLLTFYDYREVPAPPIPFMISLWDEGRETEPNNTAAQATPIERPVIINGTINPAADHDYFRFQGAAGEIIVAEIVARRLGSPLDATLTLLDDQQQIIAFNDDYEDPGGVMTHHADAYLRCILPASGFYTLKVSDAQWQGGPAFNYRLRVSTPQPDFQLRVVPSRLALPGQGTGYLDVHVIRSDGLNVPIHLRLPAALTNDFTLRAGVIAGTQTVTRVTLTTTLESAPTPIPITIEGVTTHAGKQIIVPATPAEDRMQAFFWRHLVPAQELRVMVFPKD